MGLEKLSIFYCHNIEHVSFSLEIKTMMVNLKLERTSVCAISYLGSALALGHCLRRAPYSSHSANGLSTSLGHKAVFSHLAICVTRSSTFCAKVTWNFLGE